MRSLDRENRDFGEQVRKKMQLMFAAQENLPFDNPLLLASEQNEVVDREEVQIGRFVPVVWEQHSHWRTAAG